MIFLQLCKQHSDLKSFVYILTNTYRYMLALSCPKLSAFIYPPSRCVIDSSWNFIIKVEQSKHSNGKCSISCILILHGKFFFCCCFFLFFEVTFVIKFFFVWLGLYRNISKLSSKLHRFTLKSSSYFFCLNLVVLVCFVCIYEVATKFWQLFQMFLSPSWIG